MNSNILTLRHAHHVALAGIATLFSIPLVLSDTHDYFLLFGKAGFTGLFLLIAVQDFRTQTVSPFITLPWMWMSILRGILERNPLFLVFWFVIFLLWTCHFYGGGDAKLLMGLFGLMPDARLLWIVCVVLVVTGIPVLAHKYWDSSPRVLATGLSRRVQSGALLPTDEELDRGVPFAFAYCIAGAIYLWVFL